MDAGNYVYCMFFKYTRVSHGTLATGIAASACWCSQIALGEIVAVRSVVSGCLLSMLFASVWRQCVIMYICCSYVC